MCENSDLSFNRYFKLREQVDSVCRKLEDIHKVHLKCKAGCDQCCLNFGVFPVEYYAIKKELEVTVGKCTIYDSRPVICRTHGLPLLQMDMDGENWELSCCEFNFTDFPLENFNTDNSILQDKLNSQLFLINKEFINEFQGAKYSDLDLILLKNFLV